MAQDILLLAPQRHTRADKDGPQSSQFAIPELSIIVPTFNEVDNVPLLVAHLATALEGIAWEVILVDDNSPDGTVAAARRLAEMDGRVRCLRRIGRRGLAGACVEGMLASSAAVVAVMDADLQHDETLLPLMLERIRTGADLVVGSRYVENASAVSGLSRMRQGGSWLATETARRLLGISLRDPMSGFFMVRRQVLDAVAPRLSTQGFKVLLDLIVSCAQPLAIAELPYAFRARRHGTSKLDSLVVLDFAGLLLAKVSGDRLSLRFLMFAVVGASGLVVHLVALRHLLTWDFAFDTAQTSAAYVAMTWNFALNNQLTYRDQRLKGFGALRGLMMFWAVCSVGTIANIGVASLVYGNRASWWLAGSAGALMGVVFNYAASGALTWRKR